MNQGTRSLIETEQKLNLVQVFASVSASTALKGKFKCTLGPHCAGFSTQSQRFKQHQLKKSLSKLQCAFYTGPEFTHRG